MAELEFAKIFLCRGQIFFCTRIRLNWRGRDWRFSPHFFYFRTYLLHFISCSSSCSAFGGKMGGRTFGRLRIRRKELIWNSSRLTPATTGEIGIEVVFITANPFFESLSPRYGPFFGAELQCGANCEDFRPFWVLPSILLRFLQREEWEVKKVCVLCTFSFGSNRAQFLSHFHKVREKKRRPYCKKEPPREREKKPFL